MLYEVITKPPTATVAGAPKRSASAPAINAPKGAMPRNIMAKSAMTRPRMSSGVVVCIRVLDVAMSRIMNVPVGMASSIESQKELVVDIPEEAAPAVGEFVPGQLPVASMQKPVYTGQKISLVFDDADIRNILQLIGDVSGLNILASNDVV